jgi:hypothetical protein
MEAYILMIAAAAVLINFAIIKAKMARQKYDHVAIDLGSLALLTWIFAGTVMGTMIAMIGGALVSIYLAIFPVKMEN